MIKDKQNFYIIIIISFLLSVVFYIVTWHGFNVPKYNYQPGQIAQEAIKAPFAFNVLKPDHIIENEISRTQQSYPPIFQISENIKFSTQRKIDNLFLELNGAYTQNDSLVIYNKLKDFGLQFSFNVINLLIKSNNRENIYNLLTSRVSDIMQIPIIEDRDKNSFFRISENFEVSESLSKKAITVSEAKTRIIASVNDNTLRFIISEILDVILSSNLEIDREATQRERDNIKKGIDPVITKIEKNEYIILKNQKLNEQDILKLESLVNVLKEKKDEKNYIELAISACGQFFYNVIILTIFYLLTQIFFKESFLSKKRIILSLLSFLVSVVLTVFIYYVFGIKNILLIPIPMFVLIISSIFNPAYAIIYSFFITIISGQYLNWNMIPLINLLICSIVSLIVLRKVNQPNYLLLFIYIFSSLILTSIITTLYRNENLTLLASNLFYSFVTASVSTIGAFILTPILSKNFEFATRQTLLELLDFNTPLLKRLTKEASGTYYHCLVVGNLAEACAEAISADPLVARVASYYHDIGKLENPQYFIENNPDSTELHNALKPHQSALIIKSHVENGILLGKKHKLPYQILEVIEQHHGDGAIKYFLHKAKEQNDIRNEKDFYYKGPKPKTKEAVVVMIADIVESTLKSKKSLNPELIEKTINDTITNLINEEQLIDAHISLKELHIIKKTMLPILNSIHNKRIEYPDTKNE